MNRESAPNVIAGQQREDGTLGPLEEPCIFRAEKTFKSRSKQDTNPAIVQMVLLGELISHWYYRSDQWIDQPYFSINLGMEPYIGPVDQAPKIFYDKDKFIVNEAATERCKLNI